MESEEFYRLETPVVLAAVRYGDFNEVKRLYFAAMDEGNRQDAAFWQYVCRTIVKAWARGWKAIEEEMEYKPFIDWPWEKVKNRANLVPTGRR